MQSIGTAYLRARTCLAPQMLPVRLQEQRLDCWGDDATPAFEPLPDVLVMASTAKSGALLSAKIVAEVGAACGACVASGERSRPGIPGPVEELPAYDGQIVHAIINMRDWPAYAERQRAALPGGNARVRCVTTIRDPLSRLRSLYTYARSGGEHWFRFESQMMARLGNATSLQASLDVFWDEFGRDYLVQSHEYLTLNLAEGCVPVRMEAFASGFDANVRAVLDAWAVKPAAAAVLVERLGRADFSRRTEQERKADPHLTANKFPKALVAEMDRRLLADAAVGAMVEEQRRALGYGP